MRKGRPALLGGLLNICATAMPPAFYKTAGLSITSTARMMPEVVLLCVKGTCVAPEPHLPKPINLEI
jgi:hypothetical protein